MKIAIIGLGYVGLPLAVELAKKHQVIGYDLSQSRVDSLNEFQDDTNEIELQQFIDVSESIVFTTDDAKIENCDTYIITVPTPVDENKYPDLSALRISSKLVGMRMKIGSLVVYESTVYPTATEDVCIPILEEYSGFTLNEDFGVGYSPERINPSDKVNTLLTITKVVSGSNLYWMNCTKELYESIGITTYGVSELKIAEASKIVENIQRDVNIGLMNELSVIFDRMDIDTEEVLQAAGTKWNFLNFRPGLVGGHCIGVDPYYLLRKSEELGYSPGIIRHARITNENMANFVLKKALRRYRELYPDKKPNILLMGITFKENCPDLRNSKVFDMMRILDDFHYDYDLHDSQYGSKFLDKRFVDSSTSVGISKKYDLVFVNVMHNDYKYFGYADIVSDNHLIVDVQNKLDKATLKEEKNLNIIGL